MRPVLILYATREGHTRRIAEHLLATLRARQRPAEIHDVAGLDHEPALDDYDAVILAASIHIGKHEKEMIAFVKRHRDALERIPTAFLSVSMTEATAEDPKADPAARLQAETDVRAMIDRFCDATGWHPKHMRPVAGALAYTQYGRLKRFLMKRIARAAGGPTDTSRDWEFTDWEALDRFVDDVLAEPTPASAPI